MDRQLHAERLVAGTHRRRLHEADWAGLPAGAFVIVDDGPALVHDDAVVPWSIGGYGPPRRRPGAGRIDVVTPPSTVDVLRSGYVLQVDASAGGH
jgi:hypothetical protein